MTMNRLIHIAVRRDLARIEGGLRGLREGDRARADLIQRTWDNLRAQLTRHHEGEDTYIWPWLLSLGVDPDLLAAMESEHEALAAALRESGSAISTACASASHERASEAADVVARARGVVDQHLAHEESELEPLLAPHVDSPGWKDVEKKLRGSSPVRAGHFFAWVQDGATADERAYLRSVVPGPVLLVLGRVLGRGYSSKIASGWS